MTIKVLYIDGVGPFGGASRSLFEALRALPMGEVAPLFLMQRGTAQNFYGKVATDLIGVRGLTRFDNTRYSFYRGVRWLVLLRELFHLPFTLRGLARARAKWPQVDLIHANEITEILPAILAKMIYRVPLVIHVRSVQRKTGRSWRTRIINRLLARYADRIIAIDEHVRSSLPADLPVTVIHNSFSPAPTASAAGESPVLKRINALPSASLKVGFVGNLHHSKGVFDLVEAARIVKQSGTPVDFILVGGATRKDDNIRSAILARFGLVQDVQTQLGAILRDHGLEGSFHLLGPTLDIQAVYPLFDVVCFPSHFDAPGRPVFEAAFFGVPAIAAVSNPQPDTLIDGETGIAIPPHRPDRLAEAVLRLARNREELQRLGANAKALADSNFNPARNSQSLLDLYRRALRIEDQQGRSGPVESV